MNRRAAGVWFATGLGCGYFPAAPGTAASVAALVPAWLAALAGVPCWALPLAAAALFLPACAAASSAAAALGEGDPGPVVIDEILGQWIALGAASPDHWPDWLAALLLFRLFDIAKPFPISRLERLPGGYGIMADDAAAGLCAMMSLSGIHWLGLW